MCRLIPFLCLAALGGLSAGPSLGQEPAPGSAKAPKMIPGPFRAYVVTDNRYEPTDERNRSGKPHCSVCEYGLHPAVMVVARSVPESADGPLAKLLQGLEQPVQPRGEEQTGPSRPHDFGTFAIFLNLEDAYPDDPIREQRVAQAAAFGRALKPKWVTLAIAEKTVSDKDGKKVPSPKLELYGIAEGDEVTVLFYDDLKILNRWTFTADKPLTDADVRAILAEVDKHLAPKPRGTVASRGEAS
ncbi:MAG TPA: hypothetical protein VIL46_08245 [Gemmataceae bacterium]